MDVMAGHEKTHALLLENIHPDAVSRLQAAGCVVETVSSALDEDELIERIPGVHLLGVRSKTQVTARVLEAGSDLLGVGAFCIGTDQIDLAAAARAGVAAFNAPFSNTRSVVELALAEIIMLARRAMEKNTAMHAGIVGYGNIGTQLSVLAEALGMRVYFYDSADKLALGNAKRCDTLDELLEVAETITLHVDGRLGNSGFFGEEQFARMRPRSLFLNLSRGFVIDYPALRRHLESGHIAGAAIDVFPKEPKGRGDEFQSELRGLPNVILTPHIGGSTEEAQADIGGFVANKLAQYASEGNTTLSVNLPTIALPQSPNTRRIAHVHHNTPGVLAQVNSILAEHSVNIEGQLLATRGEYGYLLTDVGVDYPEDVLARLRAMEQSIRLRVLS